MQQVQLEEGVGEVQVRYVRPSLDDSFNYSHYTCAAADTLEAVQSGGEGAAAPTDLSQASDHGTNFSSSSARLSLLHSTHRKVIPYIFY